MRLRCIHRPCAVLALALVAAAPAEAQREQGRVRRAVETLTSGLRDFVAGPPPATERTPPGLRPCGSLYGPEARQIARGPELLNSYDRWIRVSYPIIQEIGPLPVCFEYGRDTLTSNQGRYLLEANNQFLRQHRNAAFVLTGYTDPQERSPVLALRRAEVIQASSAARDCRYRPRRGATQVAVVRYRKVEYSPDPAASSCLPPSRAER